MLLWRVVLLVGVILALALGGAALWQNQQPPQTCRYVTIDGDRVEVGGSCHVSQAHHHAEALGYAAVAVVVVTLASMPLLRLRDRA